MHFSNDYHLRTPPHFVMPSHPLNRWEEDQIKYPETAGIVQAGIDKLEDYSEHIESIPAYVLAMSLTFIFFLFFSLTIFNQFSILLLRWDGSINTDQRR